MCGRYTLINLAALTDLFPWIRGEPEGVPRFNIAPSQPLLVVANDDREHYQQFKWGLVPFWAKDPAIGNQMCNARAEGLATKNAYKNAYRRRRCLIPADGFYEWKTVPGSKTKQPMYIRMRSGEPFAFAGLWEKWNAPDGSELRSATIITTGPNELIQPIHNRMPVILRREDFDRWLDAEKKEAEELDDLLRPYAAREMEAYPISTLVNNVRNQGEELLKRAAEEPRSLFG